MYRLSSRGLAAAASAVAATRGASSAHALHDSPQLDGIAPRQLDFLTTKHGIDQNVRHGGRGQSDLLTHLTSVRKDMSEKFGETSGDLEAAALFHSIYGTEGFQGKPFDVSRRSEVQAVIGEAAEVVAFLNCVMDRSSLDQLVAKCLHDGGVPDELTILARPEAVGPCVPRELVLTKAQLVGLLKLHFADWANLVAPYSFWHYRRQEYRNIALLLAAHFGCHQYQRVHEATMATEPADSMDHIEVPEMVRARELGIADAVLSGKIPYEDLQSHKLDAQG
jgi:hypothetical protein